MVKFNKEMREKRRLLILQKLSEKKTIADISEELNCGVSTVFRIKKSYANYLIKLDYNKPKNNERLKRKYDSWKRKEKEANINESYFYGFSLKEKKRIRKSSIPYKARLFIYKKCKDRNTGGANGVSIEKIRVLANRKFKGSKKLSSSSIARFLRKKFKRTYTIRKRPILTKLNIQKRQAFAKQILEEHIDSNNIFFTDEKKFLLHFMPNKQTNKIRLCKKTIRKIKQGNINEIRKVEKEIPKHSQGIMVAGGVCANGVGKLKFVIGTMDTCAYKQTLDYYKEDLINLSNGTGKTLLFQQDNAPCHVSKGALQKLETIDYLRHWPPNSPDLSPIETIWSIVQSQLEGKEIKNIEDLKTNILYIWNRIPSQYCKRICEKFLLDIKTVSKTGYRVNKRRNNKKIKFILNKNPKYKDVVEQIVYNETSLSKIKTKEIKRIKNKNKIRNKIIRALKKKAIKDYVERYYRRFDKKIFGQVIEETSEDYKRFIEMNEKRIIELSEKSNEEYFKELTMKEKNQIVSLYIPKRIEEKEDDETEDESEKPEEQIKAFFRKNMEIKKKAIKHYINEFIRINIIKNNN